MGAACSEALLDLGEAWHVVELTRVDRRERDAPS